MMMFDDDDDISFTSEEFDSGIDDYEQDNDSNDLQLFQEEHQDEEESVLGSNILGSGLDKEYYTNQLEHEMGDKEYYEEKYLDSLDEDSDYWTNYYKDKMEIAESHMENYQRELDYLDE